MHYVYIIKNSVGKLYAGITSNPEERLKYHNTKRGAQYTKHSSCFEIVFLEKYDLLKQARTREIQIKKWRRDKKEMLISKYMQGLETKQNL
jgi:putative endonuclease